MNLTINRNYSTTVLLSPIYSLGFCASLFLIIQLISGYILASNYMPSSSTSFGSINHILMRELDSGWLLRYLHVNGCAFLFIMVYLHMLRTLDHNSLRSKTSVWLIGIVMFLLLCLLAFTGYSLVYGQMSLWAIVVICSLVTAIPSLGSLILIFLWGDNLVSDVTLQRIFTLHSCLPFFFLVLLFNHLSLLHVVNSTGDLYTFNHKFDRLNFYPLLLIRDVFIGSLICIFTNLFVYFYSDLFGHPDNYVPANPLVTPDDLRPEFYLLPFYALIRAIPSKLLGILGLMILASSLTSIGSLRFFSSSSYEISYRSNILIFALDLVLASHFCLYSYSIFHILCMASISCFLSFHTSQEIE